VPKRDIAQRLLSSASQPQRNFHAECIQTYFQDFMNNATAAVQTAVVRVTPGEFLADSRAGVRLLCLVWTCFAGKIDFPLSHLA
jgi:hypothetical protein